MIPIVEDCQMYDVYMIAREVKPSCELWSMVLTAKQIQVRDEDPSLQCRLELVIVQTTFLHHVRIELCHAIKLEERQRRWFEP